MVLQTTRIEIARAPAKVREVVSLESLLERIHALLENQGSRLITDI